MFLLLPYALSRLAQPDAYLDPGSGSIILQVLIAALLGASFFLRGFWMKLFKRGPKNEEKKNDQASDDPSKSDPSK
jgi:hypothetical protein